MRNVVKRLLLMQLAASVCVAITAAILYGGQAALATLYGGLIALVMTVMLGWRVNQATRSSSAAKWLMLGAVERMITVCVAFAAGIGLLGLMAVPVLMGFGMAELAYYVAAGPLRRQMIGLTGRRSDGQ